jgi:hypothetical protein
VEGERRPTARLKTGAWFIPAMVDPRPVVRLRSKDPEWDEGPPLQAMAAA